MWKIPLGTCLCAFGAINFGLSFKPVVEVKQFDPLSSQQQVIATRPYQGIALTYSLLAILGGTGLIGSGTLDKYKTLIPEAPTVPFPQLPQPQETIVEAPAATASALYIPQEQQPVEFNYEDSSPWEDEEKPETEVKPHISNNDAEIASLIEVGCLGIIGFKKGSGKTSKLGWLIAEHLKKGHQVWLINPFCAGKQFKGIKVWGRGLDYRQAAEGIRQFVKIGIDRMKRRGDENLDYDPFDDIHIHLAMDELSNYGSTIDEVDPELMSDHRSLIIQYIRQMNLSVSFASHGDTLSMLGGEKALGGKAKTLKNSITWLYAQAKLDNRVQGNYRCAGWADLIDYEGGKQNKSRIEIPSIMQGPQNYDYTELISRYCPQNLWTNPKAPISDIRIPEDSLSIPEDSLSIPDSQGMTPESYKQKLIEGNNQ